MKDGLERDFRGVIKDHKSIMAKIGGLISSCLGVPVNYDYWCGATIGDVKISVSPARQYRGRFDGGKENWTIDIQEFVSHSRMGQVRINWKDKEPSFDGTKLKQRVAEMQGIADAAKVRDNEVKEARSKIPKNLPEGMSIRFAHGIYELHYAAELESILALVEICTASAIDPK